MYAHAVTMTDDLYIIYHCYYVYASPGGYPGLAVPSLLAAWCVLCSNELRCSLCLMVI